MHNIVSVSSIKQVAVLGAGIMGAQIAAHLANAKLTVLLFDLAIENNPRTIARNAITGLCKLKPPPLVVAERTKLIQAADYYYDLEAILNCDLIIEAITENYSLKATLYSKIVPFVSSTAILTTNTSGLSLQLLSQILPADLRTRFCGMHFFNPPRYMPLVELIPCLGTNLHILDVLESFLVSTLGKGVIRCKDTRNFIANRIGIFSMVSSMHYTNKLNLRLDLVDALTGPAIGRSTSATYRTADLVGLDTLSQVILGTAKDLKHDPWQHCYVVPYWMTKLIERGYFGKKSGIGIYADQGKQVIDPSEDCYIKSGLKPDQDIQNLLSISDASIRWAAIYASHAPQAQFLWSVYRDVLHYAAVLLPDIADNARDIDLALRWGYGWALGPFEMWQAAGWNRIARWITADIKKGLALSDTPLPDWVWTVSGVHQPYGSYSVVENTYKVRSTLPVYNRQLYPLKLLGEADPGYGDTVFENQCIRLWTTGDNIGILSTKCCDSVEKICSGILESIKVATKLFKGLIIWHNGSSFFTSTTKPSYKEHPNYNIRATALALKYASIPVIGIAMNKLVGWDYEMLMHCDQLVIAIETTVGMLERVKQVPILPSGGGCKEFAMRSAKLINESQIAVQFLPWLRHYLKLVFRTAYNAEEAKQLGYISNNDLIIFNPYELLYVAKELISSLLQKYQPPMPQTMRVTGHTGIVALHIDLLNMHKDKLLTQHEYLLGKEIARIMCGGELETNSVVSEAEFLALESKLLASFQEAL